VSRLKPRAPIDDDELGSDVTVLSGPVSLPPPTPAPPVARILHSLPESSSAPSSQPNHDFEFNYASQPLVFSVDSETSTESDSEFPFVDTAQTIHKSPIGVSLDAEHRFLQQMREAREKYAEMVQQALLQLNMPNPPFDISNPPVVEEMTDLEMEEELATFGFRFTTRESAISKLTRCWAAKKNKDAISRVELDPIEFIRSESQYYEQILTYQAIPLAGLLREMTDAGIKMSIHRLRSILDEEGVAFLDERAATK
jgi:hypothetical protein